MIFVSVKAIVMDKADLLLPTMNVNRFFDDVPCCNSVNAKPVLSAFTLQREGLFGSVHQCVSLLLAGFHPSFGASQSADTRHDGASDIEGSCCDMVRLVTLVPQVQLANLCVEHQVRNS